MELSLFKFNNVCLGGSFDHIHIGHTVIINYNKTILIKILLSLACLITRNELSISITSEKMVSKKCSISLLETFDLRCENVQRIIKSISNIEIQVN
jgi:phosphopantetheine adenylyltransferase